MTESASAPWGINGFFSPQFPCQFLTPPSSHQFTLSLVTKHSGHVAKIKPKILLPLFPFDLSCSQNLRIIVAPRKVIALHKNWEAVGRLHFEERTPNMHKTSFCVWVCSRDGVQYEEQIICSMIWALNNLCGAKIKVHVYSTPGRSHSGSSSSGSSANCNRF